VIDRVTRHPHDSIGAVDHDRHPIAVQSCDFPVNEEVLEFFPPSQTEGPEPVSRSAVAHGERRHAVIAPDERRRPVAQDCTQPSRAPRYGWLNRNHIPDIG
jgi:hypothetical protein